MTEQNAAPVGAANDGAPAPDQASPAPQQVGNGTIAGAPESTAPGVMPWPQDWRAQLAGADKGYRKTLDRYATPNDYFQRTRHLERMISSGQHRRPLPDNASEQEIANWRADHGIPDKPEDYAIELPDGVGLGEADKPVVKSFTRDAHANHWPNAQVNQALAWYYSEQDAQRAKQDDSDVAFKARSETALREQWQGADYRRNLAAVNNLLATMPEELAMKLLAGRAPDGRKFGDDPHLIGWLARIQNELNPHATLLPAGSGAAGTAAADRMRDLKALMGDRNSDYWRGPKSEALQQEYRALIEGEQRGKRA